MGGVFISYRRADSPAYARSLADALSRHFGADHVFFDRDGIEAGARFPAVIGQALDSCQVLLALIGPGWLKAHDEAGRRRLDDSKDFVHREIVTALGRPGVVVIPILLNTATMPAASHLPKPLAQLAERNARRLGDESWGDQVEGLITELEKLVPPLAVVTVLPSPSERRPLAAELEVVPAATGTIERHSGNERLSRVALSRELWGEPDGGPFDFRRNHSKIAARLATTGERVREHLSAAQALVPDYPARFAAPAPRVGILRVKLQVFVTVRNSGTESGGITFRSSGMREVHPDVLQEAGGWATYSVHVDAETRHEVPPGTPIRIPLTVWLSWDRKSTAYLGSAVDSTHAVGIARVSRAFADFLCQPITGINVDTLSDDGHANSAELTICIVDAHTNLVIDPLDVDELERHTKFLDNAISAEQAAQIRRSEIANQLAQLQKAAAGYPVEAEFSGRGQERTRTNSFSTA